MYPDASQSALVSAAIHWAPVNPVPLGVSPLSCGPFQTFHFSFGKFRSRRLEEQKRVEFRRQSTSIPAISSASCLRLATFFSPFRVFWPENISFFCVVNDDTFIPANRLDNVARNRSNVSPGRNTAGWKAAHKSCSTDKQISRQRNFFYFAR